MRKTLVIAFMLLCVFCQAQTQDLFGRIPQFLSIAPTEELEEAFKHPDFSRFSSTLEGRIEVAYENSSEKQIGSFERILEQIQKFQSQLSLVHEEKPAVEIFNWADYQERMEIYPCGLVAVFKDGRLSHIWIDLQ